MDDLIYASATELARNIRDKKVSALEVVDAHLRRIEEVNPRLNAVVQLAADRARAEARESDEALARGEVKGFASRGSYDHQGLPGHPGGNFDLGYQGPGLFHTGTGLDGGGSPALRRRYSAG